MPSTHPADALSITRLEPWWAFAACWIVTGMVLYVVGTPPAGPTVFPDEVCRLGWARLLSGTGPHFEMSPGAYCQPYYALLLAPFQWLTHDPEASHRAVFAINSVFAGACLPLAVRLGIRHFGMDPGPAWIAGIAILAYPSLTLYSHHALPETALFPGVLLAFALWCNWVERPGWRQFAVLLAMSVVLYALHRKMMVVPMALMGGAIIGYWSNRTPQYRLRMLLAALALAGAFMLDEIVKNIAMAGHLQTGDAGAVDLLARFLSLEHLQNASGRFAGVLVYASLLTGGIIWLILGAGLDSSRRVVRDGFGSLDEFTKKSAFAFGMVVLLGAVTATYFSGTTRFDTWFYGRHVDAVLGTAMLPAIALIARRRINGPYLWWTISLALLTFLALAAVNPGPPWEDFSQIHVIGAGLVMEWMYQAPDRWVLLAYSATILALAGAICLACIPGLFRFAALAPFAIVTATIHLTTQPFEGVSIGTAISEPAARMLREAEQCHIHWDARNAGRLRQHQYFRLQYYFPHCSIKLVPTDHPPPPNSLVIVPRLYVDCESERECHDLHPDLALYKTASK